ncbi:MAG TPA: cell wall-binding repeat-containing protein [Acidimicrobiales bacterium]
MPASRTRRWAAASVAASVAGSLGLLAAAAVPAFGAATAAPPDTSTGKPVTRLAGDNRIGTAIAISQNLFPNGGAGAVVLTAQYDFPDAMSAGPLGKFLDAPILLTDPGMLTPATLTEIERVLPAGPATSGTPVQHNCATPEPVATPQGTTAQGTTPASASTVYIIGGPYAIAPGIDAQLEKAGYDVVRIAGTNRFDTSVHVAQCEGSPPTVLLATGRIFADALSAGPAAASVPSGGSVVLTDGPNMPPSVASYLGGLTNPTVYAVGAGAAEADPQATALFGGDRFATSVIVAQKFFPTPSVVGVATGADFPDALAGGGAMGLKGGPVLMSGTDTLPSAAGVYLSDNHATIGQGFLFGGPGALSYGIQRDVWSLINNQP